MYKKIQHQICWEPVRKVVVFMLHFMVVMLLLCCAAFVLATLEDPDIMHSNERGKQDNINVCMCEVL